MIVNDCIVGTWNTAELAMVDALIDFICIWTTTEISCILLLVTELRERKESIWNQAKIRNRRQIGTPSSVACGNSCRSVIVMILTWNSNEDLFAVMLNIF